MVVVGARVWKILFALLGLRVCQYLMTFRYFTYVYYRHFSFLKAFLPLWCVFVLRFEKKKKHEWRIHPYVSKSGGCDDGGKRVMRYFKCALIHICVWVCVCLYVGNLQTPWKNIQMITVECCVIFQLFSCSVFFFNHRDGIWLDECKYYILWILLMCYPCYISMYVCINI